MLVSFYVNDHLSTFGEGDWEKYLPQIGSEFHAFLDKDGKMCNYKKSVGVKHTLVVDKIVYAPYINDNGGHDHIPFNMCDVKIYLIDKPKNEIKSSNID